MEIAAGDDDFDEAIDRIVKAGNRASDVISRLRALSRKAPPLKDGLAINEAVLDVIALTRSEVVKNGISLRTELKEGLPLIQADRVQLQQVILNLIMNAVEPRRDRRGGRHGDGLRSRTESGECRPCVRGLLYDQAARHGHGTLHLPYHRRSSWWTHLGLSDGRSGSNASVRSPSRVSRRSLVPPSPRRAIHSVARQT